MTRVNSFSLDGLSSGKLPVYVRFRAQSTRIQHTTLSDTDTTRRAGDGG